MSKKPLIDKGGEVRELTADDLKKFKPIAEVAPELLAKSKKVLEKECLKNQQQKSQLALELALRLRSTFDLKVKAGRGVLTVCLKNISLIINKNF